MFAEGQRVSYVGEGVDAPSIGDEGIVVALGNTASYVKMATGAKAGEFIEVSHHDLAPLARRIDTDIMGGGLVSFSVREVAASQGASGLLARLRSEGHLANFDEIASTAAQVAGSLVRSDPSMQEVIANLDAQDADELVSLAVVALLRDAFGRSGD